MAGQVLTLNEQFQATLVEQRITKLSLAVLLHDELLPELMFSFTIPEDSDICADLDNGHVAWELQEEFGKNGFVISDTVKPDVVVENSGREWRITYKNRIYLARRRGDKLYIHTPGKRPIGRIKVSLKEHDGQAVKNPSGYYLFTNIEDGDYTIQVEADYYFDEEKEVTLPLLDPENPSAEDLAVSIILKPMPFYPFPTGTTSIKGVVKEKTDDGEMEPVPGVTVEVLSEKPTGQTTDKGEFALYFTWLTKKSSTEDLRFTLSGYEIEEVPVDVEEGKTASVFVTMHKTRL